MKRLLLLIVVLSGILTSPAFPETRETNKMRYIWDGNSWKVEGYIRQQETTPTFKKDTYYYYDNKGRLDSYSVVETPKERIYNGHTEQE